MTHWIQHESLFKTRVAPSCAQACEHQIVGEQETPARMFASLAGSKQSKREPQHEGRAHQTPSAPFPFHSPCHPSVLRISTSRLPAALKEKRSLFT